MNLRKVATIGVLFAGCLGGGNAAQGRWSDGAPLDVARSEVAVAAVGETIYVIGGFARGAAGQVINEAYDVAAKRWSTRASLPRGLNHVAAAAFDGKVYAFGGFSVRDGRAVADAYVYDPAADRWSAIAPLPSARGAAGAAVLDDKIHIVGGNRNSSITAHDV